MKSVGQIFERSVVKSELLEIEKLRLMPWTTRNTESDGSPNLFFKLPFDDFNKKKKNSFISLKFL